MQFKILLYHFDKIWYTKTKRKGLEERMKLLNFVLPDIKKYTETVAKVIGMDVEVMDTSFIRIAGTGFFRDKVGLNMEEEAHIYHQVLQERNSIIISNPRRDSRCTFCYKKENCLEELEISTPILYQKEAIGVIGLICFDKNKKADFLEKQELYIQFLQQISEFISYKLQEFFRNSQIKRDNEILKNIINRVQDSIILTDTKNNIELINQKGKSLFPSTELHKKISISHSSTFLDKQKFQLSYSKKSVTVIGDIFKFSLEEDKAFSKTLLVFKELSDFKNYVTMFHQNSTTIFLESPQMQKIYSKIAKVSKNDTSILITGESGTGKEIIAKQIHESSQYASGPFVTVNCGAIPESLMESELFGYTRGAFTGADPKGKIGFFEQAQGGSIFLDEIGDMPLQIQVKMLRVLQDKKITPIGSREEKKIHVRIIAATNKDLDAAVKMNMFREDLFYRLSVFPIYLPPLRERKKDIRSLVDFFVKKYYASFQIEEKEIDRSVYQRFLQYSWPGNIREVKNTIEYCMNMIDETETSIQLKHLPSKFFHQNLDNDSSIKTLAQMEKEAISKLLETYGNSTEAKQMISNLLDIGIATLYRKLKLYKL